MNFQELLRATLDRQRDDANDRAAARRRVTGSPEYRDLLQAVPAASPEAVELLVTRLVTLEIDEGRL